MNPEKPVVFVVDDDYRVREALSSLISSVGLDVAAFGLAAEFLQSEKPDSPACLVLDIQLPGTTGLELQRELAAGAAPPIVFITGHGDIPSSVRAMKAGAIEFLSKPFDDQDRCGRSTPPSGLDRSATKGRSELAELRRHYALLTPREREVLPFVDSRPCQQADRRRTWHQRDHHRSSSRPDHAQDGRALARRARQNGRQTRRRARRRTV